MSTDVRVIQVIVTRLLRRGRGTSSEDVMRIVEQYWDMDGGLLWEIDTWDGRTYSPLAADLMIRFNEGLSDDERAATLTEMTTAWQQVGCF